MGPWTAVTAGWQVARWTATAILKSPGNYVDLYFRDRYVVISKRAIVAGFLLLLMAVALAFAASYSQIW